MVIAQHGSGDPLRRPGLPGPISGRSENGTRISVSPGPHSTPPRASARRDLKTPGRCARQPASKTGVPPQMHAPPASLVFPSADMAPSARGSVGIAGPTTTTAPLSSPL